ncbi:glutamate-5-semialdehyde dehydrogenase [soil metagenome]
MFLKSIFESAKNSSYKLGLLKDEKINDILHSVASETEAGIDFLLAENEKDLIRMSSEDPKYDRLKLTEGRIKDIANDIRNVADLKSPLGKVLDRRILDNGLEITKISVPLGVIGIIYEARPNVTFDVFSLCLKSGNACILKGGSDAENSNKAILKIIHKVLSVKEVSPEVVQLLPVEREATEALLQAVGFVDIIIPRGSQGLINFVRQNSKVPVIETGAGIVHTYFDETADLEKGKAIIHNAKTRRVSVCNALDCLLINESRIGDLPDLTRALADAKVEIFADEASYQALKEKYPANLLHQAQSEHFGTEFLSLKMSVKTVKDLDQALEHINKYSSKHSEAIISENNDTIDIFLKSVDAAAVYANSSTAFTDGAQFGLGAEIGISTQKLHARGPMALDELTSYKWIIKGNGQIRSS